MGEFLTYVAVFEIVSDIFDVVVGSSLIFGALKWRKGLLTTTSLYWGFVLGFFGGLLITNTFDTSPVSIVIGVIIGGVIFPILTYTTATVNRFVLGFIVIMKLLYMFTTYMCKEGAMEIDVTLFLPLVVGTIAGIIFMLWERLSVLPFILACAFLGASQVAPTIAKYINQFIFGVTHDYSLLFDPVDFIFALFKIELTDGWTLLFMIILMLFGSYYQFQNVKKQGYSYDTPVIVFETNDSNMHGKIIS